jgi:hypothetical protein
MSFNRDGSRLATTSKDKKLRIIDPRTGLVTAVSKIIFRIYYCTLMSK